MPHSQSRANRAFPQWLSRHPRAEGALPDAMIIGAQKAGTTSLFAYLEQHPSVSVSHTKEVHFFDTSSGKGEAWYRRQFEPRVEGRTYIEASPYYLFHPRVPERARRVVPSAKLLVLLREPVARAFSNYQHQVQKGREPLTFEQAIRAEKERLGDSEERLARGEIDYSFEHQHFSYLSRGFYAVQIERWLKHFPRDAMLILKAEDMFASPQSTFDEVCNFLGLRPFEIPDPTPRYQRDYEALSDEMRDELAKLYDEPNRRLAEMTGISWA